MPGTPLPPAGIPGILPSAMRYPRLIVISGVALQAKLPAFAPHQQHPIGAAMWGVASGAAFYFQRCVLIDIGPALFRVTVHASLRAGLI